MALRIALLRSDGPHHSYLERVLASRFRLVAVVEEPGREQVRRLWRKRRWGDWFWWSYHGWRRRWLGLDRYRTAYFADGPALVPGQSSRVTRVRWINDPAVPRLLRQAQPDVTVVIGTSILKSAVLDEAGSAVINIHGGRLPEYRGNHCFFFPLYHGRPELAGSTIHFVNGGVDTGDVIEHVPANACPGEIPEVLYCRAERRAIHRLADLLHDLEAGLPLPRQPPPPGGHTYRMRDRKPHHDLVLWFHLGALRPPPVPDPEPQAQPIPGDDESWASSCRTVR
jgi:methionyl-tRNA formyltransferase